MAVVSLTSVPLVGFVGGPGGIALLFSALLPQGSVAIGGLRSDQKTSLGALGLVQRQSTRNTTTVDAAPSESNDCSLSRAFDTSEAACAQCHACRTFNKCPCAYFSGESSFVGRTENSGSSGGKVYHFCFDENAEDWIEAEGHGGHHSDAHNYELHCGSRETILCKGNAVQRTDRDIPGPMKGTDRSLGTSRVGGSCHIPALVVFLSALLVPSSSGLRSSFSLGRVSSFFGLFILFSCFTADTARNSRATGLSLRSRPPLSSAGRAAQKQHHSYPEGNLAPAADPVWLGQSSPGQRKKNRQRSMVPDTAAAHTCPNQEPVLGAVVSTPSSEESTKGGVEGAGTAKQKVAQGGEASKNGTVAQAPGSFGAESSSRGKKNTTGGAASRHLPTGSTRRDLIGKYSEIFPTRNRNAAAFRWETYILDRAGTMDQSTFAEVNRGFCAVSGSPISGVQRNVLTLPGVPELGGTPLSGVFYYCCWPCICDMEDLVRVDTKTVNLADGPREYKFAVHGNPCEHPEELDESFTDPFSGRPYVLSRVAPEVRCGSDGQLIGATLSDHGYPIIGVLLPTDDEHAYAMQNGLEPPEPASEFREMCEERAANGYNSGMGEIFRKVCEITPFDGR